MPLVCANAAITTRALTGPHPTDGLSLSPGERVGVRGKGALNPPPRNPFIWPSSARFLSPSPPRSGGEGRGEVVPCRFMLLMRNKRPWRPRMNNPVWSNALKSCADPERARRHLNLLAETSALPALEKASPDQARILCALFSGSQALSALLIAHPDWLASLTPENLQFPRREQGLRREVEAWLKPLLKSADQTSAHSRLRQFKQREMLRIGARDLARLGTLGEILREISDVADLCLDAVWQLCRQQFIERFGQPYHQDAEGRWHASEFCVLGLGKLGGQELNYS